MAHLVITKSGRHAAEARLGEVTVLGRDATADVTLPSEAVSRHHARISRTDDGYLLEDMGSVNGTAVNRNVLKKGKRVKLKDGDIISIWRYAFEFIEADSFLEILERFPEG